jgi:fluoride ion exporter CrcB/FEX
MAMSERPGHHDEEKAPELSELGLTDKPDGPAAAAMLAAGIGILVLGILTVLSEASVPLHDWLEEAWAFREGVGPLAGKTTLAVIAWAVSWLILGMAWRRKDPNLKTWFTVSIALGILGALGTFPPIFLSFAAE